MLINFRQSRAWSIDRNTLLPTGRSIKSRRNSLTFTTIDKWIGVNKIIVDHLTLLNSEDLPQDNPNRLLEWNRLHEECESHLRKDWGTRLRKNTDSLSIQPLIHVLRSHLIKWHRLMKDVLWRQDPMIPITIHQDYLQLVHLQFMAVLQWILLTGISWCNLSMRKRKKQGTFQMLMRSLFVYSNST